MLAAFLTELAGEVAKALREIPACAFPLHLIYLQENAEMELGIQNIIGDHRFPLDFTIGAVVPKDVRLLSAKNVTHKVPILGRCDDNYGNYAS
jgi:hypothetical protein